MRSTNNSILKSGIIICLHSLWLLLTVFPTASKAQHQPILTGTVKTIDHVNLQFVTVLLIRQPDSLIINYTETNENGQFSINLPESEGAISEYILKVNLLGFQSQEIKLNGDQKEFHVVLQESQVQLKEVIVTAKFPFVKMSGDTTTYRADDFAGPQDRTIGDVLKKVPGITVADNGQIRFNGQSIARLYLDGDDLLESKYNIATRTIPNEIVNQIQVLENHQSIKALEGKVFSDAIDINLTFKEKAKLRVLGQVDAGGGLTNLYEGELNAISLKNIYKAIHTAKMNNTAKILSDDILSFNALQEAAKRGNQPEALQLSTGTGYNPALDKDRYFFNHSGLANSANLWKLKTDAHIKSKVYYQYDGQEQVYRNKTDILFPDEIVSYSEHQNNSILHQNLYADIILHENKPQFYLNNKSAFQYKDRRDNAFLLANDQDKLQYYRGRDYAFSNEADLVRSPKRKTLTQYYSYITYQSNPEVLTIDRLRLLSIFQTSDTLINIRQRSSMPSFFTNNHVTIQNSSGRFSQSYKLGVSANIQELKSSLLASATGGGFMFPDSSINQLSWNDYRFYIEPNYEWKAGNFKFDFKLPLRYQLIHAQDQFYNYRKDDRRLLHNANFSIRYNRQKGFSGNIYFIRTASAGNFLQAYQGLVLNNYRSISQNDDIFSTSTRYSMRALLTYKNPVKLLFINISGSFQETVLNTIAYGRVDHELSYTERRMLNNTVGSYNVYTSINKYLFTLKSSIDLSYSIQLGKRKQFINEQLYPFVNESQHLNAKWNGTLSKSIRYFYRAAYQTFQSYPEESGTHIRPYAINNTTHEINFEFDLSANLFLKSNISLVHNKNTSGLNSNYFFTDLSAIYKLKKMRTDIVFEGRNLANVKSYQVTLNSLDSRSFYEYPLRSRMLVVKGQFRF